MNCALLRYSTFTYIVLQFYRNLLNLLFLVNFFCRFFEGFWLFLNRSLKSILIYIRIKVRGFSNISFLLSRRSLCLSLISIIVLLLLIIFFIFIFLIIFITIFFILFILILTWSLLITLLILFCIGGKSFELFYWRCFSIWCQITCIRFLRSLELRNIFIFFFLFIVILFIVFLIFIIFFVLFFIFRKAGGI